MCWYKHLIFCGKKFYLMTKPSYVIKNNEYKYYCNNNNTYKNSINGKKHSICKCQILYVKHDDEYYIINNHSDACLNKSNIIYENKGDINIEIKNFNNFKNLLI